MTEAVRRSGRARKTAHSIYDEAKEEMERVSPSSKRCVLCIAYIQCVEILIANVLLVVFRQWFRNECLSWARVELTFAVTCHGL